MSLPLKNLSKQMVALGFNLASDAVVSGTYKKLSSTAYNPATGTPTLTTKTATVKAMILQYDQKIIDGTIVRIGDERILIQASELKEGNGNAIVPTSDDLFDDGNGTIRKLLSFKRDPTGSLYEFQARREVSA